MHFITLWGLQNHAFYYTIHKYFLSVFTQISKEMTENKRWQRPSLSNKTAHNIYYSNIHRLRICSLNHCLITQSQKPISSISSRELSLVRKLHVRSWVSCSKCCLLSSTTTTTSQNCSNSDEDVYCVHVNSHASANKSNQNQCKQENMEPKLFFILKCTA